MAPRACGEVGGGAHTRVNRFISCRVVAGKWADTEVGNCSHEPFTGIVTDVQMQTLIGLHKSWTKVQENIYLG